MSASTVPCVAEIVSLKTTCNLGASSVYLGSLGCCTRVFASQPLSPALSRHTVRQTGLSAPFAFSAAAAVHVPKRHKATFFRIANRKKVENFIGKRFHLPTRLRTAAPEVAAEWDYEANPCHVYPEIIGTGNVNPVWWRCSTCDASFCMSVEKRVVRGFGCPNCTAAAAVAALHDTGLGEDGASSGPTQHGGAGAGTAPSEAAECEWGGMLEGEQNASLRHKRPPAFTIRTRY